MLPQEQIESIKRVSIVSYLLSLGVKPVKYSGVQLVYFSPKHTENTPSFFVHPDKNVFHDYTTDERGDIIRLVCYLTGCTFLKAVEILQTFEPISQTPTLSFSGQKAEPNDKGVKWIITDIKPLANKSLLEYVHERCISTTVAKKYLKEIHYKRGNKRMFAIAFENDKGGFEIRNPYWKSSTSPKCVTTLPVANSSIINLFEGFFDFLSSCCYFGITEPRNSTVILNSTSNINHVLDSLKNYKQANIYFDNDDAGRRAKQMVVDTGIKVFDGGKKYYPNHNDFNSFLTDGRY
ncbi:MAG: toprim domain-containing protein [Bacteroidetes bacterium]|nr:toprim domain-containing protein [Bacteroidota bacterium]